MFDWKKYQELFVLEFDKTFNWMNSEFSKLQSGRANPNLFSDLKVSAYGEFTPLNQLANIAIPEPRTLTIKAYDRSILKDIMTAINAANLGLNPQLDADLIRINFPAPTEETRKNLVKKAKQIVEDAKVKVRLIRQNLQDNFKKEPDVLEDDKKHFQTELDKITKEYNSKLENAFANKEKDIMTI